MKINKNDEELANKAKKSTKKTSYFVVSLVLCSIMTLLSLAIYFFSYLYSKSLSSSTCGLLEFMSMTLNGDEYFSQNSSNKWAGLYNIREIFNQIIVNIEDLDTNKNKIFINYDTIIEKDQEILDLIEQYSTELGEKKLITPSPDSVSDINTLYQRIYSPYDGNGTILGIIYTNYLNSLNNYSVLYTEMKNSFNIFYLNKEKITSILNESNSDITSLISSYDKMKYVIGNNFERMVTEVIQNKLILSIRVVSIINLIALFLCIILTSVYNCVPSFRLKSLKVIIHITWNIFIAESALSIFESAFIGIFCLIARKSCSTFHYLISNDYMSTEEGIELFGNLTETQQEYFHSCIYDSNLNLAKSMPIKSATFDHIDLFYKNYKILKDFENNIPSYESNITYFENQLDILRKFLNDYSLSTNYDEYNINDVTYNLEELSKWTDFTLNDSYQTNCITGSKDQWFPTKDYCPSDYPYTLDGSNDKNCLLICDWNLNEIKARYLSACLSIYGNNIINGITKYFSSLDLFENKNKELINDMIDSVENIKEKYLELLQLIKNEIQLDEEVFSSFNKPFSEFNDNNTIYNMFDCRIIKNELTGFYDKFYFEFHKFGVIELVLFLFLGVFNYACCFFIIRSLYKASNNILEKINETEEDKSSSFNTSSEESKKDGDSSKKSSEQNENNNNEQERDPNVIIEEENDNDDVLNINKKKNEKKLEFNEEDFVSVDGPKETN